MSFRAWMQASLLLLTIGLLIGVHAQSSTTGNITGTVRDPQGASVPKVEVTITDEKTGAARTVRATEDGFYNATSLPAGTYTVSAAPSGFKKTLTTGVELHVNENKTVNLDLQVGQVTETVTVTSEAAPVELRSGEVSSATRVVAPITVNLAKFSRKLRALGPLPMMKSTAKSSRAGYNVSSITRLSRWISSTNRTSP